MPVLMRMSVVDGDFAVTENELRTVLKSLREAGINIVAIHSHMTGEEPRIIFFNYWGRGPAQSLAQSIQKALPAGLRYRQNLARMSDESVGFCYKTSCVQCNHFTPRRLNRLFDILPSFRSFKGRTSLQTSYI